MSAWSSALADNSNLGFDNACFHAQLHPLIALIANQYKPHNQFNWQEWFELEVYIEAKQKQMFCCLKRVFQNPVFNKGIAWIHEYIRAQ